MKVSQFGTATLRFGAGDAALIIETSRSQISLRPIALVASWFPLPVAVTSSQYNSFARLIAYKGVITNENVGTLVSTQPAPWSIVDNSLQVFLDVALPYLNSPFKQEFRDWPDDLVRAKPGETLGCALIAPFDLGTGLVINGDAVLTFIGDEVADQPEQDVRKLRAL